MIRPRPKLVPCAAQAGTQCRVYPALAWRNRARPDRGLSIHARRFSLIFLLLSPISREIRRNHFLRLRGEAMRTAVHGIFLAMGGWKSPNRRQTRTILRFAAR